MKVKVNNKWEKINPFSLYDFGNYTILTSKMVSGTKSLANQRYIGTATHLIIDDSFPTNSLNSLFRDNQTVKSLVILTDKFINMTSIFYNVGSQFEYLFINTSNVTNISNMFRESKATTLDLSSFDTSKITDMSWMFSSSQATRLDLSSFDTSSVTNTASMFKSSKATAGYARTQADANKFNASSNKPAKLNFVAIENYTILTPAMVSGTLGSSSQRYIGTATHLIIDDSFPTDNLDSLFRNTQTLKSLVILTNKFTDMNYMFYESKATSIDVFSFDTSKVTDMRSIFRSSQTTTLNLSLFDTLNATNMNGMFYLSKATSLDLSSFNTSKVTDMSHMFRESQATSIDISSFDTSKVTVMNYMFYKSKATSLDVSSFDTSKVTSMNSMFRESQVTSLDLSSFDTSNVTDMKWMFYSSKATTGYARTQADANRFNASSGKPAALNFIVKP